MNFSLLSILFTCVSLMGCASISNKANLNLSKIEKINWQSINTKNAEGLLGTPDMKANISSDRDEEVWIYLDGNPKSTKLSLIFITSSGSLQSANWFIRQNDEQTSLDYLMNRYGKKSYREENVRNQSTTLSSKMKFYTHDSNGPEIAVYAKSGLVSSLSWEVNPSQARAKRSPTSH